MDPPIRPPTPRTSFQLVIGTLVMIAVPAAITLHTAKVSPTIEAGARVLTPFGYTISLLLFIVPISAIALWFLPRESVHLSKKSFLLTIGLMFPVGAGLDFFFAHRFFIFPNPYATLRIPAPALGGGVPIEEYVFYLTGFIAILLIYIWLDEYWLNAYSIPPDSAHRTGFERLLRFHPQSFMIGVALIAAAVAFRTWFVPAAGFPGYFIFLVVVALGPSSLLFPSALPVINWRAFSLTFFLILLISLLWEATLALPYGWWGFQDAQMLGIYITAWSRLPLEEVVVWCAVSYATVIVYEVVRRWKASGLPAMHAFFGRPRG